MRVPELIQFFTNYGFSKGGVFIPKLNVIINYIFKACQAG